MDKTKPIIVVSKCLGFDSCRYNGAVISNDFVDSLRKHVEFKTVCPEVEIGLGIPRDPIRIVQKSDSKQLLQYGSDMDLTEKITGFSSSYLSSLSEVDGFILKSKSPSCGITNSKIYNSSKKNASASHGPGFFAEAVLNNYPELAVEDEGRLNNFRLREHFLSRVFINARFRKLDISKSLFPLIKFHSDHKYLFMSLNQKRLGLLGKILANHSRLTEAEVYDNYKGELARLVTTPPKVSTRINALHHVMGYFSKIISSQEKEFILELIENYRNSNTPFGVPLNLLRSYAIREENTYLKAQTFFEPFPVELVKLGDSGKGRLRR